MLQLPENWRELKNLTGLPIPSCLTAVKLKKLPRNVREELKKLSVKSRQPLPLKAHPSIVAALIKHEGQEKIWAEAGGIDLWKRRFPIEIDDGLCRSAVGGISRRCVGSPMRAQLGDIEKAEKTGTFVAKASVGNTSHHMNAVLGLFNNGKPMHYGPYQGHTNSREAIALMHHDLEWAISSMTAENIILAEGVAKGLLYVFLVLANGKSTPTVLMFSDEEEGIWPNYNDLFSIIGAKVVWASRKDSDEVLSAKIASCDWGVLIYPAIFGTSWTLEEARRVSGFFRQHRKFIVIDAVYNAFQDPETFISWVRLAPEIVIELGSISKEEAAGAVHFGSIKCMNTLFIDILRPFMQMILCMPDIGQQEKWFPAALMLSRNDMLAVRPTYVDRVKKVMSWSERFAQLGVRLMDPPAGPYVVADMPFDAGKFNAWLPASFRTKINGQLCTGVGTAMGLFYPASPVGQRRFRISCVLEDADMEIFMTVLYRAVLVYLITHHSDLIDWERKDMDRVFVEAEAKQWLADMPSNGSTSVLDVSPETIRGRANGASV